MTRENMFYYVLEEQNLNLIVRAAQTRLRNAVQYTHTDNIPARFIVGPITSDDLHKLFPKTQANSIRS